MFTAAWRAAGAVLCRPKAGRAMPTNVMPVLVIEVVVNKALARRRGPLAAPEAPKAGQAVSGRLAGRWGRSWRPPTAAEIHVGDEQHSD